MSEQHFIEVYRARDDTQVRAMQQALEEAGIRTLVENDLLQGALGATPPGWATAPRILARDRDAARARAIVEREERSEAAARAAVDDPDGATACLACGARMPAGDSSCRACGWSYTTAVEGGPGL